MSLETNHILFLKSLFFLYFRSYERSELLVHENVV